MLSFVAKGNYSPGFIFPNDGWSYSQQGWQICRFAERGIKVTMETFMTNPNMIGWGSSGNITAYDFFTSYVYSLTGYSPLSLFFISSVTGSLAAIFIYLIAIELFSKNIARISSLFAFFWPSFILWSTQNLKEPMIAMIIFILLWSIFYIRKHHSPLFLFTSIVAIFALLKVSFPIFIVISGALFLYIVYLFMDHLLKDRFLAIIVLCLLVLLATFFMKDSIISFIQAKSSYNVSSYKSIFEFLGYHRSAGSYGNLRFFQNLNVSNLAMAVSFAPLGLIFAIFAPFPWQLGSAMQIMAAPETIIFYMLFPFTIKGVIFAFKKRFNGSGLILTVVGVILIFLGLVEGNAGTLFRHRAVAFYLLFIFTAIGMVLEKKSIVNRKC